MAITITKSLVTKRVILEFVTDDPSEVPKVIPLAGSYEADESLRNRIEGMFRPDDATAVDNEAQPAG